MRGGRILTLETEPLLEGGYPGGFRARNCGTAVANGGWRDIFDSGDSGIITDLEAMDCSSMPRTALNLVERSDFGFEAQCGVVEAAGVTAGYSRGVIFCI